MLDYVVREVSTDLDTTRPSLLLRIRDAADSEAWEVFDAIYRPMVRRFALAHGIGPADADDVVQQCLAAVAKHIPSFEYDPARGRFKGWLRTLVNNRVRNLFRDRRDRQADTHVFGREQQCEAPPEEVFERIWLEEHLWHCLRELESEVGKQTYLAYRRYVLDQRPIEEVCQELGLSRNNVYTIKWRLTERISVRMKALLDESY